jgi:L-ribulose-5-phosphate 3-epimerase
MFAGIVQLIFELVGQGNHARIFGVDNVGRILGAAPSTAEQTDADGGICSGAAYQRRPTLIPLAQELKVVIAIEEVWNKFLLSPLEMAKYVSEFQRPWIKAWFDVGNVLLYGYPQDWIHTLGNSIVKVHVKGFQTQGRWLCLGQFGGWRRGLDWPAVRQAFADIGYSGSAVTELEAGDEAYLRDVVKRFERLVLGRG